MDLQERWGDVYREAILLGDAIEHMPDGCPCGDADGHIEGRCPCCGEHSRSAGRPGKGENCSEILAGLRVDITMFYGDFRRVAAPFGKAAPGEVRLELRQGVFLAASDLDRLVTALDRIDESAVGFRRTCAASELGRIKRYGAALRTHCDQIEAEMRGGVADPARE